MERIKRIETSKLKFYTHKINGTIQSAIKNYEAQRVGLGFLLTDYNDVLSAPEELEKAVNPWVHKNKSKREMPMVRGVTIAETLFNISAMSLVKQEPIEVIKSIYYRNKKRNNSALESFFWELIDENINEHGSVTIVNPSPMVVEQFQGYKNIAFIIPDGTISELYSKQFSSQRFIPFEKANQTMAVDTLVIFTGNLDAKEINIMYKVCGKIVADNIYGIVHNNEIDDKTSSLWKYIYNSRSAINEIIMMPKEISNSSPRKKMLLTLCSEGKGNGFLKLRKVDYDGETKTVSEDESVFNVTRDQLLKSGTVNALWNELKNDFNTSPKKSNVNAPAKAFKFSKEIVVSYSVYDEKKYIAIRAYYKETVNTDIPTLRGKSLTPKKRKGLKSKIYEEIVVALEKFVYEEEISGIISEDIVKKYLDEKINVSLKTLWFILRPFLKNNKEYDEKMCREIFANFNYEIASINPEEAKGCDIRKAICEQVRDDDEMEYTFLKMMNLIFEAAIKKGYLADNPILSELAASKKRASKRQEEIRAALLKKSFEAEEERKIVEFLLSDCERDGISLALLIKMMTGSDNREICGLLWRDFEYYPQTDTYSLSVTKAINNAGSQISFAAEEEWEKYRLLPIPQILGELLKKRKEHLVAMGVDVEYLLDSPIIVKQGLQKKMLRGCDIEPCRPVDLSHRYSKVLKIAGMEAHNIVLPERNGKDVETDINKYNGNIFRENFKYKAINIAGLSIDELNFCLGLKQEDTYAKHYCDFSNQYVQMIISKKLDRWFSVYPKKIFESSKSNVVQECFTNTDESVPCVEGDIINNASGENAVFILDIETEHGFKIIISKTEKESENYENKKTVDIG